MVIFFLLPGRRVGRGCSVGYISNLDISAVTSGNLR